MKSQAQISWKFLFAIGGKKKGNLNKAPIRMIFTQQTQAVNGSLRFPMLLHALF